MYELPPSLDRRAKASLVFESEQGVRRVRDYPAEWRTLSDDALFALSWTMSRRPGGQRLAKGQGEPSRPRFTMVATLDYGSCFIRVVSRFAQSMSSRTVRTVCFGASPAFNSSIARFKRTAATRRITAPRISAEPQ